MFLEMVQNCPQPEVGPKILFIEPANTIITSTTQTPPKSTPSDTILHECIKRQSIHFKEQPQSGGN